MKSRFPFTSFPNGWFCVALSDDLPLGGVMPLHYFGKDLVLFRTEDGKPHLLDAHCPHLGAHLGYGGKVRGDAIQCPFHGWLFNGNGHCMNIPYASHVPPKTQIPSWPIQEVNGLIMVYHHAQGSPPTWEIPELPEYLSEEWTPLRQVCRWKIYSHVQEILENGLDIAHLPFLHSSAIRAVKNYTVETKDLVFYYSISLTYKLTSTFVGIFGSEAEGSYDVTSYGLGWSVSRLHIKSLIELSFLNLGWITPIDEEYLDVRLVFSMKKVFNEPLTRILGMIISKSTARAFEEDIPIFEHKAYRNEPFLCEGDGPIVQFRRWTRQFYSDLPAITKLPIQQ
jgi:phenylpropionate dioxygenase-like ring-hydroxylating dioxygenase large terminal subunit